MVNFLLGESTIKKLHIKGAPLGVPSFAIVKSFDQLLYGFNETGIV